MPEGWRAPAWGSSPTHAASGNMARVASLLSKNRVEQPSCKRVGRHAKQAASHTGSVQQQREPGQALTRGSLVRPQREHGHCAPLRARQGCFYWGQAHPDIQLKVPVMTGLMAEKLLPRGTDCPSLHMSRARSGPRNKHRHWSTTRYWAPWGTMATAGGSSNRGAESFESHSRDNFLFNLMDIPTDPCSWHCHN